MQGLFITMEGIDGCGKSTQIELLSAALEDRGLEVLVTREPGGTAIGEAVRGLLSSDVSLDIAATTELFLIVAARAQHVAELIRPALEAGKIVISDRYTDSTVAFQGHGRGLDLELIERINELATGGLRPDITLLFDLDPEQALGRRRSRSVGGWLGAVDDEKKEFHARVQGAYLKLASAEPGRVKLIDASLAPEEMHLAVLSLVIAVLEDFHHA